MVAGGSCSARNLKCPNIGVATNPRTDIFDTCWFLAANGGPGSDSKIGWLTELGTFQVDERSLDEKTGAPKLFKNPNAWSTLSNMVIFSHPAPVGYSYCDSQEDCYSNDERAGDDLRDALQAVMDKFPTWKGRDLYLTGESYAGICESVCTTPRPLRSVALLQSCRSSRRPLLQGST